MGVFKFWKKKKNDSVTELDNDNDNSLNFTFHPFAISTKTIQETILVLTKEFQKLPPSSMFNNNYSYRALSDL